MDKPDYKRKETIGNATIYLGDCIEQMREHIADGIVQTCITSPPYFGLRDYGHEGQIGLEETPDAYVERLVEVFREVRRVLRDDGTLWLNLGDSYANTGNKGQDFSASKVGYGGKGRGTIGGQPVKPIPPGLKQKDLIGIPWRVAFALQSDGWYLRQDIIWHKPNPMPESVRDRCTKAHEYLFLLSKSPRYYFDAEAMKEQAIRAGEIAGGAKYSSEAADNNIGGRHTLETLAGVVGETRNKRSVWTVTTKPFSGAHFAVFPPELIEPCVLAGCPADGLVFDPFTGSGTTGVVSGTHGRRFVGCELNPEYAEMARERIASAYAQGRLFD